MSRSNSFLLKPFAAAYGYIMKVRNWMFDHNLLKERQFSIPVVCVGNIFVGGTGKTPHVEMLLRYFHDKRRVAVVSRGYKRKTKGMIVVGTEHTPVEVGDEPCQIKHKFPDVTFIVCESRSRAIRFLEQRPTDERPELILMDDGFQHRYVKPKCAILLFPYMTHPGKEPMLPLGRMRESFEERHRADLVVISKCPEPLEPIDLKMAEKELELYANQKCFFSGVYYDEPKPMIKMANHVLTSPPKNGGVVLLPVACIASPQHFLSTLEEYGTVLPALLFRDHHRFTRADIRKLFNLYKEARNKHPESLIVIVTTEKDAMRMREVIEFFPKELLPAICYFPIRVKIQNGASDEFFKTVEDIVFNRRRALGQSL